MRRSDITPGAEVYYAEGEGRSWRYGLSKRATVVDPGPYRIVNRRQGAFVVQSWHRDPAGTAVLVDLDEGFRTRRTAVYRRHLRGLWHETLAATGRTAADVKAAYARLSEIAAAPGPVTLGAVLAVAAADDGLPTEALAILANLTDEQENLR